MLPLKPAMVQPQDFDQTQRANPDNTQLFSLRPELRVFGHYVLQRQLGAGGMGEVWLAQDEQLEEQVALKFVLPYVRTDKRAVELLKQEVRTAHRLSHPNIVRVYSYLEDCVFAAVSMEFVDGESLDELQLREANKVFDADQLRPWVKQLCDALDYAHDKVGIVHRDLKPRNLMVDRKGDLKVMDFGISAVIAATTARSSLIHAAEKSAEAVKGSGTLTYMSPQQHESRKPAPSDDLYALGVTLYDLLTGTTPFTHSDIGALIYAVMNTKPVSMAERRADYCIHGAPVPEAWERAVAACLAKKPEHRPANATQLWKIIEGGVSDAGVAAAVDGDLSHRDAPHKRGRLTGVAVSILALALIAAGTWWMMASRKQKAEGGIPDHSPVAAATNGAAPVEKIGDRGSPIISGNNASRAALTVPVRPDPAIPELDIELEPITYECPTIGQSFTIPFPGITMVPIAPGNFTMGSESGKFDDGRPVTSVSLTQPFWIGKTEVTQKEWQTIMEYNPSVFKGEDLPVEEVSWDEAMSFCAKLTQIFRVNGGLPKGYVYTLPTEAQWEYACRAGTRGDYAGSLDSMGWYNKNSGDKTHRVGAKQANPWGLHDMHGNVWEWCLDYYADKLPGGTVQNPQGPRSGENRVWRGGGWRGPDWNCRSGARNGSIPSANSGLGFRVCLAPQTSP